MALGMGRKLCGNAFGYEATNKQVRRPKTNIKQPPEEANPLGVKTMRKLIKGAALACLLGVSAAAVTSGSASAWGWGPWDNGWGNGWGNGTGNLSFSMGGSGWGNGNNGWGPWGGYGPYGYPGVGGYGPNGYGYPGYGYPAYGFGAPYGYAPVAPVAPAAPQAPTQTK